MSDMSYFETLQITVSVAWASVMVLLLLAAVINAANGDGEAAKVAAWLFFASAIISVILSLLAAMVWGFQA